MHINLERKEKDESENIEKDIGVGLNANNGTWSSND